MTLSYTDKVFHFVLVWVIYDYCSFVLVPKFACINPSLLTTMFLFKKYLIKSTFVVLYRLCFKYLICIIKHNY